MLQKIFLYTLILYILKMKLFKLMTSIPPSNYNLIIIQITQTKGNTDKAKSDRKLITGYIKTCIWNATPPLNINVTGTSYNDPSSLLDCISINCCYLMFLSTLISNQVIYIQQINSIILGIRGNRTRNCKNFLPPVTFQV